MNFVDPPDNTMYRWQRVTPILIGLTLLVLLGGMQLGYLSMGPVRIVQTLLGHTSDAERMILLDFRLPRVVFALLVGMGISVSGVLLQGVLRNDLAAPGILGVAAGGNLSVILVLLIGGMQLASPWIVPGASIVGGLATMLLVCLLAYDGRRFSPIQLLLTGVAVSAAIGSITLVVSLYVDRQVYAYTVAWMSGSLSKGDWNYNAALAVWMAVLLPLTWSLAPTINILRLGDEVATGLGLWVHGQLVLLLALAVALSAVCMALAGGIVFLGLLGPHIARRLVGPNHVVLLPTAALMGALLLLAADTAGRTVLAPAEIPAGVAVSALGAPYFLFLLMRT